jgi:PIN like domain
MDQLGWLWPHVSSDFALDESAQNVTGATMVSIDSLGCRFYFVHSLITPIWRRCRFTTSTFAPDVPDNEWLPEGGCRGWILLSKDYRIRYNRNEIDALRKARLRAFLAARAGNLRGQDLANLFVQALPKIIRYAHSIAPPFVYRITKSGNLSRAT